MASYFEIYPLFKSFFKIEALVSNSIATTPQETAHLPSPIAAIIAVFLFSAGGFMFDKLISAIQKSRDKEKERFLEN